MDVLTGTAYDMTSHSAEPEDREDAPQSFKELDSADVRLEVGELHVGQNHK
jgi:hypothetical protein